MQNMIHVKCRQEFYPFTKIKRFLIPDEKVPWHVKFLDYNPSYYTSNNEYNLADKNINDSSFKPAWNMMDGNINRKSFMKSYVIDDEGYPLNPVGRTGIKGRGILRYWGPNHAADPIVTRWKRDRFGKIMSHELSRKCILQFIGIERRDTRQWAIPGGMVDRNEVISTTLKREFMEEALNTLEKNSDEIETFKRSVDQLFFGGHKIYEGYVDDPRNTDNSWIETSACNFHDENNTVVGNLPFEAGDDAANVKWIDIDKNLDLYASHIQFLELVSHKHNAHW
ncbi:ADP-ribose pyrophosphatase, mitochondrial [Microplitis demolitor]|uniref:ADP-ribose pyrophosphatase, mitochondrial n=1 Tax=Microplitis demolitor TaxID=69319 RepID=UPI0004CCA985|nr:ADP-ribose pyrophosphatase, mitochondrial [Microplitis demolitor]